MLLEYLKRGVLAGGVAGAAYGLFLFFVANPLIEYIHESQHDHGHDHSHHAAEATSVVIESTTAIVSVGGGLLWAIFLGGLFGLALYLFEPAIPGSGVLRAYVLAACGFMTVSATPWLVLPPAPPGSEHLYGVDTRLALYGGLVVLGAIVALSSAGIYKRAVTKHWLFAIAASATPIVGTAVVVPAVTPTVVSHPGLSTNLVAAYRAMVVSGQAGIWLLIAATFGWLQRRVRSSTVARSTDQSTDAA